MRVSAFSSFSICKNVFSFCVSERGGDLERVFSFRERRQGIWRKGGDVLEHEELGIFI
jgi:hypothetical protein